MSVARFPYPELLQATEGRPWNGAPAPAGLFQLATDTRAIPQNAWFIPLIGERFDGHEYLATAVAAGACGAFLAASRQDCARNLPADFPLIVVDDPLASYLALAGAYRRRLGPSLRTVALTGSSGKTTIKDMLVATLGPLTPTQGTQQNFNNEVGVCQTLLATEARTRLLVVEMGMRGLGQIRPLSAAAAPDVAMVANVGSAHLGLLGSREAIAQAKCEIFEHLTPSGAAIVNGDDPMLTAQARRVWAGRLETFSLAEAQDRRATPDGGEAFSYGDERVTLAEPGDYRVANALAVLKAGAALGFSVAQLKPGLQAFRAREGRGAATRVSGLEDVWVVNDAYNANPDSMKASLTAYLQASQSDGRRHALALGAMKELGEQSQALHAELGKWLASFAQIDLLACFGQEAVWIADGARAAGAPFPVAHEGQEPPAPDALSRLLAAHGLPLSRLSIFLKGSRACRLETLIDGLAAPDRLVSRQETPCP